MALDRSTDTPGGFQVRHRALGVFQGSSIGLAFWHPSSHMPEYGLCRFATEAKAQDYVDFLSSPLLRLTQLLTYSPDSYIAQYACHLSCR